MDDPPQYGEPPYTAWQLVDLALDGHYLLRDEIDAAVRKIYRLGGVKGRERMYALPELRAYPSEPEIDAWETQLFSILAEYEAIEAERARARAAGLESDQMKFWDR